MSKKSQIRDLDRYAHHLIEHLNDLTALGTNAGLPCYDIKGCKGCPLWLPYKFDDSACAVNILDAISEEIAEKYTIKNKVKK